MKLIQSKMALSWILALLVVNLNEVEGTGVEESELKSYALTKRAVFYNNSPRFTIEEGKIDEDFIGPVFFNEKVLVICGVRNRVLVFVGKGKLHKDIKIPAKTPKMFYPNRTLISVVVNLGKRILIMNTEGKAYVLTDSFRLKRMQNLDIDVDKVGGPHKQHYSAFTDTLLRIPCSRKQQDDHEVIANLQTMKIEYQGKRRE